MTFENELQDEPILTAPTSELSVNQTSPLREAAFSLDQLDEHARQLASWHVLARSHPAENQLWKRFESNDRALAAAYEAIVAAVQESEEVTPGAEWLLDNFYIVREQLNEIREDLPRRFYHELPKLVRGALAGYPRVYALAVEIIAHTDSALDEAMLKRFLNAYQSVSPLTMGEVWAVPIMLRLGLVENLRRLADRILETQQHRRCADSLTDEILELRPSDAAAILSQRTSDKKVLASALVAHMVQRFRDHGHDLSACWHWLEQRLTDEGGNIEEVVRHEHQRQAHDQVSTGNAITSMRLISSLDWTAFFEETSLVERELRRDPAGIYARMDFSTRDRYRHIIEQLSRSSQLNELRVAERVSEEAALWPSDRLRSHIGYYLIDQGRQLLEDRIAPRLSLRQRLVRSVPRYVEIMYFGSIGIVWLIGWLGLVALASTQIASVGIVVFMAALAVIPVSEMAVGIVNYLVTRLVHPEALPKMDFKEGFPVACRSIVVVPSLLSSKSGIQLLLDRLEIHFLANPDPNLSFGLLTDFSDAPEQEMPEDSELVEVAQAGIAELNARHADGGRTKFWLFHRARRWNATEEHWMGWERKRGKISEFNRLLRGATNTSYILPATLPAELADIKYVITLDADTQLPLAAASRLVSTLAHPLNVPYANAEQTRVVRGYTILQPRIRINPLSSSRTLFAKIFSGNPNLDPYVTAVSDVYQDLFGEGSFTGKGIYDLESFEKVVEDAFPENHILSHDLIEGCHARAGLATDTELVDDFPAQYHSYMRRQHRWVRGDWQLLPWLFRYVPMAHGKRKNPLTLVSRWKIVDNLRRSLVAPTILGMIVAGAVATPRTAWVWALVGFCVLLLPFLTSATSAVLGRPKLVSWWRYGREVGSQLGSALSQCVLALAFLPHQAYLMLDAIVRTLLRVYVTRRNLLEWETAHATENRLKGTLRFFMREMAAAPIITILLGVSFVLFRPTLFWQSLPVLALWFASPLVAWAISRPLQREASPLKVEEKHELRRIARRTWLYFETFVTAEDNWLPPDNFQEFPKGEIAHRTSPTNEGMFLTSALAAHDFGYVGYELLATWLERNLESWSKVEHYRGHPYNWFDTQTLAPLAPAYISTVDSGNLAVCALTVRQGLLAILREPLFSTRSVAGMTDIASIFVEACRSDDTNKRNLAELESQLVKLAALESAKPSNAIEWSELVSNLSAAVSRVDKSVGELPTTGERWPNAVSLYHAAIHRQLADIDHELTSLTPWAAMIAKSGFRNVESWGAPWKTICETLHKNLSLVEIAQLPQTTAPAFLALNEIVSAASEATENSQASIIWLTALKSKIAEGAASATQLITRYEQLSSQLHRMADVMDFTFLYDRGRQLFAIGHNLATAQLDRGRYDLLASEARLASFLAIGKGEADYRHWFHLGRPLTHISGTTALLSWGGTMFEYLMPRLFLRNYPNTLLAQSSLAAVERQIEFGKHRDIPWGVSESAFAAVDGALNYQYQSFGVPGLGLKRGLADDSVVAPYATGLALAIKPRESLLNFRLLSAEGASGRWGYYDAVDYSPSRVPANTRKVVVQCYFAHHQGMLLAALDNCLFDDRLRRRFHSEPLTRATEMLLQEKVPIATTFVQPHTDEVTQPLIVRDTERSVSRWLSTPHTFSPRGHLLSNGHYTVMITNAGTGFSGCQGTRLSRWRPDATCDPWGQFIYVRDLHDGTLWSAGYQPTRKQPQDYEVLFSVDKAEIRRRDDDLETHMEVAVVPDNNMELRMVTITNHGDRMRRLDITSYAELVLNAAEADAAHPSFNKLFIQTEFLPERRALLAWRRPRSAEELPKWAVHVLAIEEGLSHTTAHDVQYETDRAVFIGRGGSTAAPAACRPGAELGGNAGAVLDPIFSLRRAIHVPPDKAVRLAISTGFASSRDQAIALADQYHDLRVVQRGFELAWAHAQVERRHVHLSTNKLHLYQRLASLLFYPDSTKRATTDTLAANRQGQAGLWRYGVSGDFPIVVARVTEADQTELMRDLILAHEQWRAKDFIVELVFLNEHPTSYLDSVQDQLGRMVGESGAWGLVNKRGGIFMLQAPRMPEEDRTLLFASAQVVLNGDAGSLEEQLEMVPSPPRLPPALPGRSTVRKLSIAVGPAILPPDLKFSNSFGGFSSDGREYIIQLASARWTPAPWSNVIANARFGCLVTESGCNSTWMGNSRENRLTNWSNDPVGDPPAEAIYVRDDESGEFCTPTPLPVRDDSPYLIRHGQGYTIYEHRALEIEQELLVTITPEDPVKIFRLKLHNLSSRPRKLSVVFCAEWILGVSRDQMQLHVATELDPATGALLATNRFNSEFAEQVAFLHVVNRNTKTTGDRREFLGRNGTWANPAALGRTELSGRVGVGLDPCGAMQTILTLQPGETTEVVLLMGCGADRHEADLLLERYRQASASTTAIDATQQHWNQLLNTIQVRTPSPAFDLLVNRWLIYQTLACRYWGRTAFYQSGGAYGFRDQLQDVMAIIYSQPQLAREQILRAASRQFEEGDVQHWWHPPTGRGVRTRFSDDFLWLPFVVAHYLRITEDLAILDEVVPFIRSPLLRPEEDERYESPEVSSESAPIYEHCLRAIRNGLRFGAHGLPLMGCGDWNDGMNKIGAGGKGESVWVGWFLATILDQFAAVASSRADVASQAEFEKVAKELRTTIETTAWDGGWYRRAYFDDGTPLGSRQNDACQIDSIVQSWAVLAGGDPERAKAAMQAAYERLVRIDDKLVLLFTPPFDQTELEPGYIKGYVPGVRENGGQYTHAALWMVQAFARLGQGQRAVELFELLNPVHHSLDAANANLYKVEPYVVAADVYGQPPHTGRGGWTWYTGSAAWMYRVALEELLGFQRHGNVLRFDPCISADWKSFEITYGHGEAIYHITIENSAGVERGVLSVECDGKKCSHPEILLSSEKAEHQIHVTMGVQ